MESSISKFVGLYEKEIKLKSRGWLFVYWAALLMIYTGGITYLGWLSQQSDVDIPGTILEQFASVPSEDTLSWSSIKRGLGMLVRFGWLIFALWYLVQRYFELKASLEAAKMKLSGFFWRMIMLMVLFSMMLFIMAKITSILFETKTEQVEFVAKVNNGSFSDVYEILEEKELLDTEGSKYLLAQVALRNGMELRQQEYVDAIADANAYVLANKHFLPNRIEYEMDMAAYGEPRSAFAKLYAKNHIESESKFHGFMGKLSMFAGLLGTIGAGLHFMGWRLRQRMRRIAELVDVDDPQVLQEIKDLYQKKESSRL